jgi:DNA-binding transcriptional MerR regulator
MDADAEGPREAMTPAHVRRILRRQGMPPEEIRTLLRAGDPIVIERLLELHRERLQEWLEEQRRLVVRIERSLTDRPSTLGPVLRQRRSGVVS